MATLTHNELIRLITEAFPEQPIPTKIAETYAGEGDGFEADRLYTGRTWKSLSIEDVLATYENGSPAQSLYCLTDEAYRYYLPFFLTFAIQAKVSGANNYLTTDSLMYSFSEKPDGWVAKKLAGCTLNQKHAIAMFLCFFKERGAYLEEVETALAGYWGQFVSPPPDQKTTNAPTPAKP